MVNYTTLPSMRIGQQPTGWDEWGRPLALMDIAKKDLPGDGGIWHCPHTNGCTFVVVLVRYDDEPYYFPDVGTLLMAVTISQLGPNGPLGHPPPRCAGPSGPCSFPLRWMWTPHLPDGCGKRGPIAAPNGSDLASLVGDIYAILGDSGRSNQNGGSGC